MNQNNPTISLIAAIGKNRELGRGNELIFKIPEDMKFFREKTKGHPIIMGRKTYESIGRVLPGRLNIVISRNLNIKIPKEEILTYVTSIEEAIKVASKTGTDEIFIIGGAQIYALAMPFADKLYLTLVDAEVNDADAFFPDYSEFQNIISEKRSRDENYVYNFIEISK